MRMARFRGFGDAIARAVVVGTALVVAVNSPFEWYWRVLIFFAIMFLIGLIYPNVQHAIAQRRERRYRALVREHSPETADRMQETDDFVKAMNAMSEAHREEKRKP